MFLNGVANMTVQYMIFFLFYSVKKEISELNQRSSKGPHIEGAQALKY